MYYDKGCSILATSEWDAEWDAEWDDLEEFNEKWVWETVAIVTLITQLATYGCDRLKDEGRAKVRRDPNALHKYSEVRWRVRAEVARKYPLLLPMLRCFELGLMNK